MFVQTGSGLKGLSRVRYENGNGIVVPKITASTIPLLYPAVPSFEVSDTKFVPQPVSPVILAEARSTTVSLPVPSADPKLAFELAEAKKWGYTHSAWMAMGPGARCSIRSKYPGGYEPVTPSGTTETAARVDLIEGRDPLRSIENYSGAGDYAGGIEIREPSPSVPLMATSSGVTFDDIIRIDPVTVRTTEEAAGIAEGGEFAVSKYVRYGVMAVAGWILYDMFLKPKKVVKRRRPKGRAMRRQYPYARHTRRIKQGWQ